MRQKREERMNETERKIQKIRESVIGPQGAGPCVSIPFKAPWVRQVDWADQSWDT
jgi:hypothetical protein